MQQRLEVFWPENCRETAPACWFEVTDERSNEWRTTATTWQSLEPGPAATRRRFAPASLRCGSARSSATGPGGVCLNWGCIPSKSLLNSAETMEMIQRRRQGARDRDRRGELRLQARDRSAAARPPTSSRAESAFCSAKTISTCSRPARPSPVRRQLALSRSDGKPPAAPTIEAERILIATGSREHLFPGMTHRRRDADQPRSPGLRPASGKYRGDRRRRGGAGVRLLLSGLRRQGDGYRAGKADAARLRRGGRRRIAPRLYQAQGRSAARPRLQVGRAPAAIDGA